MIFEKKKGLRRNPKAFSGRNHKFKRFFRPKTGDLQKQKEKVLPKSEGFFWPKSQIQTVFPAKNSNFFLPKKYRGGQEINRGGGGERKSGGAMPPRWRCACHNDCFLRGIKTIVIYIYGCLEGEIR